MARGAHRAAGRRASSRGALGRAGLVATALLLGGCKVDLYSRLDEHEAVAMLAILLERGIDADRIVAKDGTSTLQVDKARLAAAVEVLKAEQYPRQTFATLGKVFAQGGLVASPTEERAKFIYALSEELSHTLSQIDGVVSARIHVVLPKNDPLRQDNAPAAASVFIRHDSRVRVGELLPQIKLLVANSIEGLSYDKVSVVLVAVDRPQPTLPRLTEADRLAKQEVPMLPWLLGGGGVSAALVGAAGLLLRRRARRAATGAAAAPAGLRAAS